MPLRSRLWAYAVTELGSLRRACCTLPTWAVEDHKVLISGGRYVRRRSRTRAPSVSTRVGQLSGPLRVTLRSQPADEHFVERARRSSLAALSTMHRDLSASIGRGGGAHEPEVLRSETAMPMELPEPPALPVRPPTTWHRAARVVRRAHARACVRLWTEGREACLACAAAMLPRLSRRLLPFRRSVSQLAESVTSSRRNSLTNSLSELFNSGLPSR